ncbi:MAG: hypothetical protein AAGJ10_01060 [Bacteroidota bacterium]
MSTSYARRRRSLCMALIGLVLAYAAADIHAQADVTPDEMLAVFKLNDQISRGDGQRVAVSHTVGAVPDAVRDRLFLPDDARVVFTRQQEFDKQVTVYLRAAPDSVEAIVAALQAEVLATGGRYLPRAIEGEEMDKGEGFVSRRIVRDWPAVFCTAANATMDFRIVSNDPHVNLIVDYAKSPGPFRWWPCSPDQGVRETRYTRIVQKEDNWAAIGEQMPVPYLVVSDPVEHGGRRTVESGGYSFTLGGSDPDFSVNSNLFTMLPEEALRMSLSTQLREQGWTEQVAEQPESGASQWTKTDAERVAWQLVLRVEPRARRVNQRTGYAYEATLDLRRADAER